VKKLRAFCRWTWAGLLGASGAIWFARHRVKRNRAIVVLALHRVLEDADIGRTNSLSGILLRRSTFEQLVAYARHHCDVVDISSAASRSDSQRPRIAFTFDDGWIDNHTNVYPIAYESALPITVFVCPGLMGLDSPFWPERVAGSLKAAQQTVSEEELERVIERLKVCSPESRANALEALLAERKRKRDGDRLDRTLSWLHATEMSCGRVSFGSHTQTHQILTTVAETTARSELLESKASVERALGKSCDSFAYPNGNHSAATRRLVAEAGFKLAFTTERGTWTTETDPLAIPRVNISESDVTGPFGHFSPAMFEYSVFWKATRLQQES